MLTWAIVWYGVKSKGDTGFLPIIAIGLDTWILIEFARALGHL